MTDPLDQFGQMQDDSDPRAGASPPTPTNDVDDGEDSGEIQTPAPPQPEPEPPAQPESIQNDAQHQKMLENMGLALRQRAIQIQQKRADDAARSIQEAGDEAAKVPGAPSPRQPFDPYDPTTFGDRDPSPLHPMPPDPFDQRTAGKGFQLAAELRRLQDEQAIARKQLMDVWPPRLQAGDDSSTVTVAIITGSIRRGDKAAWNYTGRIILPGVVGDYLFDTISGATISLLNDMEYAADVHGTGANVDDGTHSALGIRFADTPEGASCQVLPIGVGAIVHCVLLNGTYHFSMSNMIGPSDD